MKAEEALLFKPLLLTYPLTIPTAFRSDRLIPPVTGHGNFCTMSEGMNETATVRIARTALRHVTYGTGATVDTGPELPWEQLKASLPREPTIFLCLPPGSVGDLCPFSQILSVRIHPLYTTPPAR